MNNQDIFENIMALKTDKGIIRCLAKRCLADE